MTANAKNLSTLANVLDDGTSGQILQSTGSGGVVFANIAAGASVYDSAALLPLAGNDAGDMAFVTATSHFYINNGTGWYSVNLINTDPAITSVQDASANTTPFTLSTDGSATVITITANDPEQVPLTYSYAVTAGSLTNGGGTTATVTQSDNVFTVTPTTTEAYAGTFSLTFTASDGINTATSDNSFTLQFITTITNSKYTTLLATVSSNKPYSLPSANNQVSSFSISAQTTTPTEVVFGDSGTKMFVLSSDRYVYSYNVSTAYNASTSSYVATSSELTELTTNTSQSFRFKPDGTVMFVSGSNGVVYQYTLSTAWDVSTISYATKSASHANSTHSYTALTFKPDGTRMYMAGLRYVMSMTLSTPWDLGSTSSDNSSTGFTNSYLNLGWVYGNTITGMDFNSTGTSLTMVYGNNASDKYIIEHPIDDPWNVSNATVLGAAPAIKYQQNTIQGLSYANSGNTLVSVLDTGDTVYTYDTSFTGINNNITDASSNNHTITVNGDAHAGTFSPYRSGGYSMFFNNDGTTSQIKYSENTNFNMGTNAFTIEGWIRPNETGSGSRRFYQNRYSSTGNGRGSIFQNGSNLYMSYRGDNGTDYELGPYSVLSVNTWTHFCLLRNTSDNTLKLYADGILLGSIAVPSSVGIYNSSSNTYIGVGFRGDMANIRVVNGTAITPSSSSITQALENVTNTVLLLNEGSVTNYSSVSMPYEAVNLPTIKPYGPLDYEEYSATDHGGAINFDGTSDYLTIPDHSSLNFASNDWTIECWVYPRTNVGDCGIWHQSASGGTDWFSIYLDGSFNPKFVLKNNNAEEWAGTAAANTAPQNAWTHIALVRRFGTDIKLYANGKVVHTETQHLNVALEDKSYNHIIGYQRFAGDGNAFDGLISDFKIDVGTAHYTAEFTPPTAPLSSSGAELHIKGTDASIIDKAQGANLKLIGNTTGSTTQVKFAGSKSMYFDGTGDYITTDPSAFYFGTGDYSIEFWYYANNLNSQHTMVDLRSSGTNGFYPLITQQSSVMKYYVNSAFQITGTTTLSATTWYHVALVRNSGTTTLYLNGSSEGNTWTDSTNFPLSATAIIGSNYSNNTGVNGYLQDFRVSNYARYTANFTPPTASLEG